MFYIVMIFIEIVCKQFVQRVNFNSEVHYIIWLHLNGTGVFVIEREKKATQMKTTNKNNVNLIKFVIHVLICIECSKKQQFRTDFVSKIQKKQQQILQSVAIFNANIDCLNSNSFGFSIQYRFPFFVCVF